MNKVELNTLTQVNNNERNFLSALNDNLKRIQAAINDTLSRSGVLPNQMPRYYMPKFGEQNVEFDI